MKKSVDRKRSAEKRDNYEKGGSGAEAMGKKEMWRVKFGDATGI